MEYLIYIAIILLVGTFCSALAFKLKVSDVFFLIFVGMIFGIFNLVEFSSEALITIAILALIFVVFSTSTQFQLGEIKKYYPEALRLTFIFLLFCLVFFAFFTQLLFNFKSIILPVLFASLMYGIDPTVTFSVLGTTKVRSIEILEIESVINTPLTIILPLVLIRFFDNQSESIIYAAGEHLVPFIQQIRIGSAAG